MQHVRGNEAKGFGMLAQATSWSGHLSRGLKHWSRTLTHRVKTRLTWLCEMLKRNDRCLMSKPLRMRTIVKKIPWNAESLYRFLPWLSRPRASRRCPSRFFTLCMTGLNHCNTCLSMALFGIPVYSLQASFDEMMWLMKVASVFSFACFGLSWISCPQFVQWIFGIFHISRKKFLHHQTQTNQGLQQQRCL